jgi:hypothetical protein
VFLPFSFPILVANSTFLSLSIFTFAVTSVFVYSSVILAWLGIAVQSCTKKKLAAELFVASSTFLAFVSSAILVQAGWLLS